MKKFQIQSNHLQDGRWKPAFLKPTDFSGEVATFSETIELSNKYFNTKEEADEFAKQYIIETFNTTLNNIEIL
ncbi:MAG: hypothetical protein Q8P20_08300 [bacterium]|nr:hypothetical protein [bacterium]